MVTKPTRARHLAPLTAVTSMLAVLLLAGPVLASEVTAFDDTVNRGHEGAVQALAEEGIVRGCEEGAFCPDEKVTRGQIASMLAAALELEPVEDGPFADVGGDVHAPNINALAQAGITEGCAADAFCSSATVTREQLASMLVRAFGFPPADRAYFDDAWATHGDNVEALAAAGVAAGCGDPLTHFCSGDPVIRWQAATFLARALDLVERVTLAPLEERREEQARIDAEREAERLAEEARRQAELEAERARLEAEREREEQARREAERLAMWESLAECESNGNWQANTGNGYYGGLQFLLQTWRSVGGTGYPHQASKEEQIARAERLLEQPWATFGNQWPACSRRLGLS